MTTIRWFTGKWNDCRFSTCNKAGYKRRNVFCIIKVYNETAQELHIDIILEKYCIKRKPDLFEKCQSYTNNCNLFRNKTSNFWILGQWNKNCSMDLCSKESRSVKCSTKNSICESHNKPPSQRNCLLPKGIKCGQWDTSEWSSVIKINI